MILLEDTRNQIGKHDIKHKWFEEHGVEIRRQALYCGDYTLPTDQSICVDTKKDIQELVSDICGKQHDRFRRECIRAQEAGITLVILVENKGGHIKDNIIQPTITSLDELHRWKNPRLFIFCGGKQKYPRATRGVTLMRSCMTMEQKYGVKFLFTTPEKSAEKIVELLTGEKNGEST